jgi:hypothetical protein
MGLTSIIHIRYTNLHVTFIGVWKIMYSHHDHVNCILIFIITRTPVLYIHSCSFEEYAALLFRDHLWHILYPLNPMASTTFSGPWQTGVRI